MLFAEGMDLEEVNERLRPKWVSVLIALGTCVAVGVAAGLIGALLAVRLMP